MTLIDDKSDRFLEQQKLFQNLNNIIKLIGMAGRKCKFIGKIILVFL
jgi:hypothetical protein